MTTLGQPEHTDWKPMDEPVAEAFMWAGPNGWMEFNEDGTAWRMWRPFNWNIGG